jgi:HAE1 family hydrophobic/amphiphilic exporter-1
MSSECQDSRGEITLEFAVGTDMSEALVKVNSRLDQVRNYPINADRPVLSTTNLSDRHIAWFVLLPQPPSDADFDRFVAQFPEHRDAITWIRDAQSYGLLLYRLRKTIDSHPDNAEFAKLAPADIDMPKLHRFAEEVIESAFERVEGVSTSQVVGGRREELQVVVDPHKLAVRQLTITDVRDALRRENKDTSGGDYDEGKRRWVVRTLGQFHSPNDVANVILASRDGAPVYVRDVAEVRIDHKKPDGLSRRFGRPGLALNCQKKHGYNVMEVMEGLRKTVVYLNENVLKQRGLVLEQVYDETEYVQSSIDIVKENILEGAVLTFITLLLFLRNARSTLIIGLHIAISTIGAFLAMWALGRSLNVLCLGGLAFAVGMLVDNAIVMLENIYRRNENGEPPATAAVRGAKEVWGALLNASAVNLAVFLPVLFIKQEAGQLFRDIALAISASVGLSLLVAIAVVPTMATRLLRARARRGSSNGRGTLEDWLPPRRQGLAPSAPAERMGRLRAAAKSVASGFTRYVLTPLDDLGGLFVKAIVGINRYLQRGLWIRLTTVVLFVGVSSVLTYVLLPKVEYLPNGNRNFVIGFMLPPPGYNLDHMMEIGAQIERRLQPYWDVNPNSPEAKQLKYPAIGDFWVFVRGGRQLFLGMRSADPMRASELTELVKEVTRDIPGLMVRATQSSLFEKGLTAGRTIDIEIVGPDIRRLIELGQSVFAQIRDPQTGVPADSVIARPSLDISNPEVHIRPKDEQSADMAVSKDDLGYMVDALIDGAYVGDYIHEGNRIDLMIRGADRFAERTEQLEQLPVATQNGLVVQLGALADIEMGSGPEQIYRRERMRAITVQVTPPRNVPMEEALELITTRIIQPLEKSGEMEAGRYRINLAGTVDRLRDTWTALRYNLVLAVVITYLLMAAMFESWLYPFVIILSVPLGAVGGFAGLWFLNLFVTQQFDVLTMLGFVILVGTVVNNPILIVEQALVHMREDGMDQQRAILESVRTRIRPIFMTTFCGLIGLLPLVVAPGAGSELYRGIGAVLLGGMIVSTIFTLVFVPTLFSLTHDARDFLAKRLGWWRTTEEHEKDAVPPPIPVTVEPPREPVARL